MRQDRQKQRTLTMIGHAQCGPSFCESGDCPAAFVDEAGTVLIRAPRVAVAQVPMSLRDPVGKEIFVELPRDLILEAARNLGGSP
jgi:hypothetical protein